MTNTEALRVLSTFIVDHAGEVPPVEAVKAWNVLKDFVHEKEGSPEDLTGDTEPANTTTTPDEEIQRIGART